jgi:hypothetical protein
VRTTQIPIEDVSNLLKEWINLGQHNAAQGLIESLEPLLGEKRLWAIVSEAELTESMRDFLNYHNHGKLGGLKND